MARFFSTNHNSLLRIATNEFVSFCIDHISRQVAFFSFKGGAKGRLSRYVETDILKKKAFRYYIKQIDSTMPCV